jgi:formylglycine-generating enzyme required for sulfatase activity
MNNGQGDGDTETGAYTLLGGTPRPSNSLSITRNPNAAWFIPTEDEWYKAAYYQPSAQGGDFDGYWNFPTGSNVFPNLAFANSVGDISNPGNAIVDGHERVGVANYDFSTGGFPTTAGSAGPLSNSFYGTADQAGNVSEWNEAFAIGTINNARRGYSGGDFISGFFAFAADFRAMEPADTEKDTRGFRLAMIPEPSSLILAAFGLAAFAAWSWRRMR